MILRLVWRSLLRRPGRSLLLLAGYALGVGVTVALLSIGSALVEQARDRDLVGGGDLAVLPAGIDLETLKTGGVSSLYFTLEQAPFLHRQVLAGPRFGDRIETAAPWIDDELVHVEAGGTLHPASAGGRIPSLARALGVSARTVAGGWEDVAADRDWRAPGDSALYAGMDRFHLPSGQAARDSTWAEWHYFNVRLPAGWLYLTYMVSGAVPDGRWGGRLLATLVAGPAPGGTPRGGPGADPDVGPGVRTWEARVPADEVAFSLADPDVRIGDASVTLGSDGAYRLEARLAPAVEEARRARPGADAGPGPAADGAASKRAALRVELTVRAASRQHLPPLDVSTGDYPSGYTAPVLDGRARGRVCAGGDCRRLRGAPAYHDHNWGVWRGVTWDWGQARAGPTSALWGGVRRAPASGDGAGGEAGRRDGGDRPGRRFLFLADTLGFLGLYPIDSLGYRWAAGGRRSATPARPRPRGLALRASRPPDTVRIDAAVRHVRTSRGARTDALFHQMEGRVRIRGWVRGRDLRADGRGFFETWGGAERESVDP